MGTWSAGNGCHLIAHRGGAHCGPENSVEAIAEARRRGASDVEIDLHQTADGELVVTHDAQLGGRFISELTLAEYAQASGGQSPTMLEEVLELVADLGLGIYLDVKQLLPGGVERLRGLVDAEGMASRTVFASFRSDLALLAKRNGGFTTSVLFHDPGLDLSSLVAGTACDFVHPCFDVFPDPLAIFTEGWRERATRSGARIICWNTNEVEVAASLMAMGVDGICSDDPAVLTRAQA